MTLKPGDPAPNFELELLTATGPQHPRASQFWILEDLLIQGPALLIFVKGDCPTCQYSLPLVDRIYQNYPNSKISLVVIAQEHPAAAQKMVKDLGLHLPVLLDPDPHTVSEGYGLSVVPTFFYVNQDAKIENSIESFARDELVSISEKIAKLSDLRPRPFFSAEEGIPAFRPG